MEYDLKIWDDFILLYENKNLDYLFLLKKILGKGNPTKKEAESNEQMIKLRALLTYDDVLTNERVIKGSVIERNATRAYELMQKKFVEMI